LPAGLLAGFARVRADPAVFVPGGVLLAFLAADAASQRAGFDHRMQDLHIRPGTPGCHHCSRLAQIGTIEVQPNALFEMTNHGFG
jgi:hypothetical protein